MDPRQHGIPWLQPIPDTLFGSAPADPATIVESRHGMRLAFVAALQLLPPRQRAVLLLRDVLAWRAAEVAELLGSTTASINSALQRARAQLAEADPAEEEIVEPTDARRRALVDRYATAFENADIAALMRLLTEDAVLEMPPIPTWFAGREAVTRFFEVHVLAVPGLFRMVPTMANGQPAFAVYRRGRDGAYEAHAVQVLTVTAAGVARLVIFLDPALFRAFGLPPRYGAAEAAPAAR